MTPSDKLYFLIILAEMVIITRQISPYVDRIQKQFNLPIQQFKSQPHADSEIERSWIRPDDFKLPCSSCFRWENTATWVMPENR